MEFAVLGPLEVRSRGGALELGGLKQRAVLALLLLEANRVVSRERLIDAIWEDEPPETARKALQVYVSGLRKVLGQERVRTRAPGYSLRVGDDELDLRRFEGLCEQGEYAEALSLWRGPPLGEFAQLRFAQPEIARLSELRLACLEDRIEADLGSGRHGELVGELEALVREHPLRQRVRGQLMIALYRSGREAEALDAYQIGRRILVEELGIEPSRELRELQLAMLNQDASLDAVAVTAAVGGTGRGVFVGRERELEELLAGFEEAASGRGRMFLLVGEPGIGKSRLADELIGRARARGARVLIGRCWESGGAPAYWPWLQSLRAYVRETAPETLRGQFGAGASDLAPLLPELRELFPGLPEPPALESESARFRLFEAASSFLKEAARTRPLVLVLDDLHAADEPSLLLLQFLARELGGSRLLVVGAYRDVDPTPANPLTPALAELAREPVTRTLRLAGLGEGEVARFIELTSGEAPSQKVLSGIYEETEGNPFFVGEIVRLLAAEGSRDADAPRIAIPQSVRDVIARRLRHLSEECNGALVLASVLGREFRLDALARLAGVSEDALLDALDEAMAARVVSDSPGSAGQLRFAHVLIRDTLYEGLTSARRVRMHRQAVEALEALYGDEPGHALAELAYHSIAGSDFEKGLLYARRAGDRALELLAYEEAARLYETALESLDLSTRSDDAMRCELLLSLGEAELRAGNAAVAKRVFLEAAEAARRQGLRRELARAAAGYGGRIMYARPGGDERLVPLLEEGIAVLGEDDVDLRARLLARLAGALRDERSRDRRDKIARQAVELARRTGNPAALAYALDGRAAAIIAPDTAAECLALGSELRDLGATIGDPDRVLQGHYHRIIVLVLTGDVAGAESDLNAVSRIAGELRQPVELWRLSATQAMFALAAGRLEDADELIGRAFSLGERAQPEMAIPVHGLQRHALGQCRGDLEEVEPAIHNLAAAYPARPVFRCVLAHLQAELDQLADAERTLHELARDGFSVLPFDMEWLFAMSLLVETCALLGATEHAPALYDLLAPWASFNASNFLEGIRGSVARYLGTLAWMLERWDDAARHFHYALEMNERMGARPWLAHTQRDYGRMLVERGETKRASELVASALATYRELGMERYAARM